MSDDIDAEQLAPPSPERVARRALVLAAIACRALIERDAASAGAEALRENVRAWIRRLGLDDELEVHERRLLEIPLGKAERRDVIDGGWRSEGMVVLAWALGCCPLPPYDHQCEPSDTANAMGFLSERHETPLARPRVRSASEIEQCADTYLTLHWRLRQRTVAPGPIDFAEFVRRCTWGPLTLHGLTLVDGDLAISGQRIASADEASFRTALSIAQERHRAFNWLLGEEPLYSHVTTDT